MMVGFLIEPGTHSGISPSEINERRKLAEAMLARSQGVRNITHPMQGVAQMVEALMAGMKLKSADAALARGQSQATGAFNEMMGSIMGGQQPAALTPATHTGTAGLKSSVNNALQGESQATKKTAMDFASTMIGKGERPDNAALQDYLKTGGANLDPATTAWCAAFVNSSLKQAGQEGTGKLNARSFMNWGRGVKDPQKGDIAVFSRGDPNGWQGHVGFFDSYAPDGSINVLGGNQSDQVSVKPYSPNRLLGFRRGLPGPIAQSAPQQPVITPTAGPAPLQTPGPTNIIPGTEAPAAATPPSAPHVASNRLPGLRAFDEDYQGPNSVPHSMRNVAGPVGLGSQPVATAPAPAVRAPMGGGGLGPAPTAPVGGNAVTPQMLAVLSNPHLNPSQRRLAEAYILPRLAPKDPLAQEQKQLQVAKLRKELNKKPDRKIIKGADGFNYWQDTGERVLPGVEAKPEKPPTSVQEYNIAKQQGFKGSFLDFKNATKSKTSLEVGPDGTVRFNQGGTVTSGRDNKTLGKELSKADAELLKAARESATASENLDSVATQLEHVIGNVGYTGPGGDAYGAVDDLIGILPGDSGARGAFRSMAMEAQLSFTEKTKGAITDREMGMFREAVPNLSQRPEGNQEIIKVIKAGAKRVRTRAEFYEKFLEKNGSLQNAQAAWGRFMEENPMIVAGDQPGRFTVQDAADFTPYLDPDYKGSGAPKTTGQQAIDGLDAILKKYRD